MVKTITVTDDAYGRLKRLKHGDESFSEAINRIAGEKTAGVERLFGIMKASPEIVEERLKVAREHRKKVSASFRKRQEKILRLMEHARSGHVGHN